MKTKKLILPFKGYDKITNNYSHAVQDIFVLSCLSGKQNGTFLDLGCGDPKHINNTYLLETVFGWSGLSIDINKNLTDKFINERKTVSLTRDCTELNFDEVLSYFKGNHIDYLSLDLEPADLTFKCLESIPFDLIEFSVITYEHDKYRFGDKYKKQSQKIFEENGYTLLCSDVKSKGFIFEDWYINTKYISLEHVSPLMTEEVECDDIVFSKQYE